MASVTESVFYSFRTTFFVKIIDGGVSVGVFLDISEP
jgi:hypothetical protein